MTANLTPPDAFAVMPVVDYEPPPRDVQQCHPLAHTAVRRRSRRAPQRHPGRQPAVGKAAALDAGQLGPAAIFAAAALRRVLEVIDRRRPAAQLHGLLAAALVDSVLAMIRTAATHDVAAVLRRVRLQAVGPREAAPAAAEVFGTYSRGRRIHAIACRVERVPTRTGRRWRVVALHIG